MVIVTRLGTALRSGHENVYAVWDAATGLDAFVALHSTARGPALGGCRMRPYRSRHAALRDTLRLSQAMSCKAALAGLPFGGGACVVIGDPDAVKSEALLHALARAIDSLGGAYLATGDSGMTVADMAVLRRVTPHARGQALPSGQGCPAAAYGTFMAIQAAVQHRFGRSDLSGRRIAVQGLGKLGMMLCSYLAQAGARLTVADAVPTRVRHAVQCFGATAASPDQILSVPVHVLSPNAFGGVIGDAVVPRIRAAIVAGGASNPLVSPRHGEALHERGVLYVPDYVANAGGVIDVALEGPLHSPTRVLHACEAIYQTTARLLSRADDLGLAPSVLADRIAAHIIHRPKPSTRPLADAMEMTA